jgi:hypothetical protein
MNSWKTLSITRRCAITLALLLPGAVFAAAPPDLAGTWEGKLAVDAKTSLRVQFTFTKAANGSYNAVLNSPDNAAIKDAPVSGVAWDGSNLKLQVPSLSGAYAGTLKAGKIGGQWTQPGGALALELAPWQKPVVTAGTVKALTGSWSGAITIAGIKRNVVFTFKQAASGDFEGTFGLPDQGANIPMSNVTFENGEVSLKVPAAQIDYKGKLNGNQIVGKLTSPNAAFPPEGLDATMTRGEYKAPAVPLKLSADAFASLKGKWEGTIEVANAQSGQKTQLPMVVRFETNEKGEQLGFVDSPKLGAKGVIVTEATMTGDKLVAKVASVGGEFAGTLAGNTLTGEWAQAAAGLKTPLTLKR